MVRMFSCRLIEFQCNLTEAFADELELMMRTMRSYDLISRASQMSQEVLIHSRAGSKDGGLLTYEPRFIDSLPRTPTTDMLGRYVLRESRKKGRALLVGWHCLQPCP